MNYQMAVTIYDVAKRAGVAPATVSKALNNYAGVSKKTYQHVMETAKAMDFTPNSTARALITKKSWLVGMLFSEELATGIKHPHFSSILSSAQIQLSKAGYDVVFITNSLGGEKMTYSEHCKYRGVDGVLIAASWEFIEDVQCILDSDINCVSVEMPYENKFSVLSDNYGGTTAAMEYLYDMGHRKIAHIAAPIKSLAGGERYQGYVDFLKHKGLAHHENWIVECEDFSPQAGVVAARKLTAQWGDDLPTAICSAYDEYTLAAMSHFSSIGIKIPDDISIIGFDDLPSAKLANLTTIRQERDKIGCTAADLLIAQMKKEPINESFDVRIKTELIERGTVIKINSCQTNK